MKIEIVNKSNNPLPAYETEYSAGMDLRAFLSEDMVLEPMQRALVPTGIHIAIPAGHEAQVRPRSGLAIKNGISVLNAPGTIDADYRGEVKVILINLSDQPFIIRNGDRIAQMIIAPFTKAEWSETENLDDTVRGSGGFGHTGL
ncbi:MAG: dUTP diphosphatase [Bacteroidales bacterium]|jgi:dUTP pyrophosphatase|nr:dUTP diphosphatase [Bacteroidales bacterium]